LYGCIVGMAIPFCVLLNKTKTKGYKFCVQLPHCEHRTKTETYFGRKIKEKNLLWTPTVVLNT